MTSCWHVLLVAIFWTEAATGIHRNCNWQTNENEIEGVLFFAISFLSQDLFLHGLF
jgi:hypothetical protein